MVIILSLMLIKHIYLSPIRLLVPMVLLLEVAGKDYRLICCGKEHSIMLFLIWEVILYLFVNNMQELMLERWTPQNTNARFPRLGITTWENNNYNTHLSDFWYLDASYIRLRSAEIAYQLPQDWLRKLQKI